MAEPVFAGRTHGAIRWVERHRLAAAFTVLIVLQLVTLWVSLQAWDRADDAAYWASSAETEARNAHLSAIEASDFARDAYSEARSIPR